LCGSHKKGFERQYPNEPVEFHEWSLDLNQKFADEAKAYWEKVDEKA
jgi:hypothetical protein